jgi:hypothetical protein
MQPASTPLFARARRAFALCALAGSTAVALSACGSTGSAASSGSSSASGSGTAVAASSTSARLKFAECMRSHGVNVPDPSATGGPGGSSGQAFRQAQQSPNFQTAVKACASLRQKSFGGFKITSAQRTEFQKDAVKFAECMRAHNIDIPDPTSNGAGGFGIFRDLRGSAQSNSPAFKTAMTACMSNLPNGGHFGGAGGPGGPAGGSSVGGPGA